MAGWLPPAFPTAEEERAAAPIGAPLVAADWREMRRGAPPARKLLRQPVALAGLGRVAERLNAAVLKTVRRANPVSGVRIPPLPYRQSTISFS